MRSRAQSFKPWRVTWELFWVSLILYFKIKLLSQLIPCKHNSCISIFNKVISSFFEHTKKNIETFLLNPRPVSFNSCYNALDNPNPFSNPWMMCGFFHPSKKEKKTLSSTLWKNEKFSLTKNFFRQINSLVTYLVKPFLSRNFWQKCVRENARNFHTVL